MQTGARLMKINGKRILCIAACGAAASLAVVQAIRYLRPPLIVERIEEAEWAFKTLLGEEHSNVWLFRYRGGLADCWLQQDWGGGRGVDIIQTVAMSQECPPWDLKRGIRYGLTLIRDVDSEEGYALELSHWFMIKDGGTYVGQKTLIPIPDPEVRMIRSIRAGDATHNETGLMMWHYLDAEDRIYRQIRLICGRPRAVKLREVGVPAQHSGTANESLPIRSVTDHAPFAPDTPHGTMLGHWKKPEVLPAADSPQFEKALETAWADENCRHMHISPTSMQPVQRNGERGQASPYEVLEQNPEAFWLDIRLTQVTAIPKGGIAVLARVTFSDDRQEMYVTTKQPTSGQHSAIRDNIDTFRRVDNRTDP